MRSTCVLIGDRVADDADVVELADLDRSLSVEVRPIAEQRTKIEADSGWFRAARAGLIAMVRIRARRDP